MKRSRSRYVAVTASLLIGLWLTPARAWKPKTHVYIANVIMADAADGKVSIPPFGEFTIRPEALAAIQNNPNQFRAGAVGPDGFPDIWTGQSYSHPNTDPWLQQIWRSAENYQGPDGKNAAWAFTFGYLTHCAADMWAHDWVNYYAGRAFPGLAEVKADPTGSLLVIARHAAIETTFEKRVAVGNRALDIPNDFVFRCMVIDPGAQAAGMNPIIQHYVNIYWDKSHSQGSTVPVLGWATYNARWFDDMDEGLRAWVGANETAIQQTVMGDENMFSALASNLGEWAFVHILDMEGAPSGTKAVAEVVLALPDPVKLALQAIGLDIEVLKNLRNRFVDAMLVKVTGKGIADWKAVFYGEVNSQLFPNNLNEILNESGTIPPESGWVHDNADHARFRQFISGINGPLYNSVVLGKMALLPPTELNRLARRSTYSQAGIKNVLLGQINGIDFSRQWEAGAGPNHGRRNLLGYGQPGSFAAFNYVFKPYTPINRQDNSLWMVRRPDNAWANGYRLMVLASVRDANNVQAPQALVLYRGAQETQGPWKVLAAGNRNELPAEMPLSAGGSLVRAMDARLDFAGSQQTSGQPPVDLANLLAFKSSNAFAADTLSSGAKMYELPVANPVANPMQPGASLDVTPLFFDQGGYKTQQQGAPAGNRPTIAFTLTPPNPRILGVAGNRLGIPTTVPIYVTRVRLVRPEAPGFQDLWMTGMTGFLRLESGPYYVLAPATPVEIPFTVDEHGIAIWNCRNFAEIYQLANPWGNNHVSLETGSHPGVVWLYVELNEDLNTEAGARVAYAYRKVKETLDTLTIPAPTTSTTPTAPSVPTAVQKPSIGVPQVPKPVLTTPKTGAPAHPGYDDIRAALAGLPQAIADAAAAEAALRDAIARVPDEPNRTTLTQVLNQALVAFPDPATQTGATAPKVSATAGGQIHVQYTTGYWRHRWDRFGVLIQPDINSQDSSAVAVRLTTEAQPGATSRPTIPVR